ncbi:hypothetical protein RJT34_26106 [Clitoria ternatea]|uniref:Uncharacterized protein n=1 Tax=Clitoria ternatea TaxID=43366 RepID=A0AAN9I7T7_CLITE
MEAFYDSLNAETHFVSRFHDKSTTIALTEKAREALKIVQNFFSHDASVLLHPELCSVMKTRSEYLSNLSVDDCMLSEMRIQISEASRKLTQWSKDYMEANMKLGQQHLS